MNKISEILKRGKALIPFITCGDPNLDATAEIIKSMRAGGADIIGLRIPFSDPVAESAYMQSAACRALSNGVTTDTIFDFVSNIRGEIQQPIIIISYANSVFSYGTRKFIDKCAQTGIEGLILLDVPLEERQEFASLCRLSKISLIPTAALIDKQRIEKICETKESFIYFSPARSCAKNLQAFKEIMSELPSQMRMPVAARLDLSIPGADSEIKYADGVILETEISRLIDEYSFKAARPIEKLIAEIKTQIK